VICALTAAHLQLRRARRVVDLMTRMTLGPEHSSLLVDPHDMR
jgi:hypothetical protein